MQWDGNPSNDGGLTASNLDFPVIKQGLILRMIYVGIIWTLRRKVVNETAALRYQRSILSILCTPFISFFHSYTYYKILLKNLFKNLILQIVNASTVA